MTIFHEGAEQEAYGTWTGPGADSLGHSFNVHGVIFMGEDEHIAPVEQAIRDLGDGLQLVKDEQAYLVVRERVHRNSESSSIWLLLHAPRGTDSCLF